ncbi:MAG: T9SS type A sorting domain-containing protein, partial [Chitinophagales bacterium]|nr:T9SS type A sorting domain-containing protein [Chitinophagales bacterium]
SSDYAVLVSANATSSPPAIQLYWPQYLSATEYILYKKSPESSIWGASIESLSGDATEFTDMDVTENVVYEYRVMRNTTSGITGEGYITAAINLQATDYRGKCLLIIDTTGKSSIETEVLRWMQDVSGDGWAIEKQEVSADKTVEDIRTIISNAYAADSTLKSVFLIGHVAVPYSGDIYPDGHPDHEGAWPADGIYGDVDAIYTDVTVDITVASRTENWNVPGDGKYDQSILKSKIELAIGRLDMYNLPTFPLTELELIKNYLDKNHAFRMGEIATVQRGLIDDNFGAFGGEAFAANGWRNFAPMVGSDSIFEMDYFSTMDTANYLWSLGCGGGWYQGAGGIGSTSDFASYAPNGIFTLLFGSYFGDWDTQDNFLRAALASGNILTNAWVGRPNLNFHAMAIGGSIGNSIRISQNNTYTYTTGYFPHYIHIALMGDPTLRMHVVKPITNITCALSELPNTIDINFEPSDDDVIGYNIYRSDTEFGIYTRLNELPVSDLFYTDLNPMDGINYYMVKAVKLEETPSGTYYNTSTGITCSTDITLVNISDPTQTAFAIYPNPGVDFFTLKTNIISDFPLQIFSIDGKLILEFSITQPETFINIESLNAGIYLVRYNGENKTLVKL